MNNHDHERRDAFASALEDAETRTQEMLLTPHDDVGLVLKCHLIAEDSLANYLIVVKGLRNIRKAKLTFSQMIELLDDTDGFAFKLKGSLRQINKIRNSFGHNLGASLEINPDSEIAQGVKHYLEGASKVHDEVFAIIAESGDEPAQVEALKQLISQMLEDVPGEPDFKGDNFAMLSKHEPREMLAYFTRSFCSMVAIDTYRHRNAPSVEG